MIRSFFSALPASWDEKKALLKLEKMGQQHLLHYWSSLKAEEKNDLLCQVYALDEKLFTKQRRKLSQTSSAQSPCSPPTLYSKQGDSQDERRGKELLQKGKCACLILAGGQGSRLRFNGPKGCIPLSLVKNKSLFQMAAEKVKAASEQVQRPLQVAIMTSPLNHEETILFFEKQNFFGLEPSQIHFFHQDLWPLLDEKGNYFLEKPGVISFGPNGNGGVFKKFVESSIWPQWKAQGIEYISLIPIDNPLADPFDASFFGFHANQKNEVSIKSIRRENPEEKVGLIVEKEGKIGVVEYFELPEDCKWCKNKDEWLFSFVNIGLFCFSVDFFTQAQTAELPLHSAKKTVHQLDSNGQTIWPLKPNAWKFEEFYFDALSLSKRTGIFICPREECFAPLKNLEGEDSIKSVQAALQAADHRLFARITGCLPPVNAKFELAANFHYPTETLLAAWKGKTLPQNPYVGET